MEVITREISGEEVADSSSSMLTELGNFHKAMVVIPEPDIAIAARNLVGLSSEEDRCSYSNRQTGKVDEVGSYQKEKDGDDDSISSDRSITSKMIIEKIFGKEEDEKEEMAPNAGRKSIKRAALLKRARKYRSLKSIYDTTLPMRMNR